MINELSLPSNQNVVIDNHEPCVNALCEICRAVRSKVLVDAELAYTRAVNLVCLERTIVERQSAELDVLYCREFTRNALLHISGFVAEWASESDEHFVAMYSNARVSSLDTTLSSLRKEHFKQRQNITVATLTDEEVVQQMADEVAKVDKLQHISRAFKRFRRTKIETLYERCAEALLAPDKRPAIREQLTTEFRSFKEIVGTKPN